MIDFPSSGCIGLLDLPDNRFDSLDRLDLIMCIEQRID